MLGRRGNSKTEGTHRTTAEHRRQSTEWSKANKERKAAGVRAYRQANRDKVNAYERDRRLLEKQLDPDGLRRRARKNKLSKYKLTVEEWNAMFAAQGNACACCRATESGNGRWHIDHDAAVGLHAVRGILCVRCNIGIGQFRDRPELLRAAAFYLEQYIARTEATGDVSQIHVPVPDNSDLDAGSDGADLK